MDLLNYTPLTRHEVIPSVALFFFFALPHRVYLLATLHSLPHDFF